MGGKEAMERACSCGGFEIDIAMGIVLVGMGNQDFHGIVLDETAGAVFCAGSEMFPRYPVEPLRVFSLL